jgi:small subunit ribosomal protein S16
VSVKIRLARFGKIKHPFYRVIVIDERRARNSAYLEQVGTFSPMEADAAKIFRIDAEKVKSWVAKGAQLSQAVSQLLIKAGHPGMSTQTGAKPAGEAKKAPKIRKKRYHAVKDRVKKAKRVRKTAPPKTKKKDAKK